MRAVIAAALLALTAACTVPADEPTAVQPAESGEPSEAAASPAALPVKMTAKKVPYPKDEYASGGPYSCAKVVVINQSQGNVQVNPFSFAITGKDGEKREAAVGAAKGEFSDLTLAPGEKASGVVCAETTSPPKVITFAESFEETARAEVG